MRWLRKRARRLRKSSSQFDRIRVHQEKIIMQPTGVLETSKAANPLQGLLGYGQSMWLDYIRRDLITSGKLKTMIEEDGLRGMTSNPSIFEKAIAESSLYDDILKSLATRSDLDATGRFELIAIRDIQDA